MDEFEKNLPRSFVYFNDDLKLLLINILLQGYFTDKSVFSLQDFLKGDYWDVEHISEEIRDTEDYTGIESYVLYQAIECLEELNFGEVERISFNNFNGIPHSLAEFLYKNDELDRIDFAGAIIREYGSLEIERNKQILEVPDEERLAVLKTRRVDVSRQRFSKTYGILPNIIPQHFEIKIEFQPESVGNLMAELDEYLASFSLDDYKDHYPDYQRGRQYYAKQLQSFYKYLKSFEMVEGKAYIPFSELANKDFEIVKLLSTLERKRIAKVLDWDDNDGWAVKFHKTPITIKSLSGIDEGGGQVTQPPPQDKT